MSTLRLNDQPLDSVELFQRHKINGGVQYVPVLFTDWQARIELAIQTQNFKPVYLLLARTSTEPEIRYYPVPCLLDQEAHIPYFAEDAYQRIHTAIHHSKVATTFGYSKVATKIGLFAKVKSFFN